MTMLRKSVLMLGALAALAVLGCAPCKMDSDCPANQSCQSGACGPVPRVCEAASTLACSCADGSSSTRVCAADGSSYGDCQCNGDTTSSCTAQTCGVVPDLVGKDLDQAGDAMAAQGLSMPDPLDPTAWQFEMKVNDPPVQILAQDPAPGTMWPKDKAITLRVTMPPDQESLGLPHANFLVANLLQDDENSSTAYYDAMDPLPYPKKLTLAQWKQENGFGGPVDDEASAIYGNKGDLGFGRHMHM
ncbi:MAG: PASTA domain-containing protein, partial [Deltaproteobacteria bacterium]|nr:PASTA domain-containing protein [Deltaproteobacteria bacterium]